MKKLNKINFFSDNLVKKRNFFINILILSSITFVLYKNIENIRYINLTSDDGKSYRYDRFSSTLRLTK